MANRQPQHSEQKSSTKVTRRGLLKGTGFALAASALPLKAITQTEAPGATSPPAVSVIQELSAYMSSAGDRPLPEEALEKAKHHILDTIAAMISGADLPPAKVAFSFAGAQSGQKTATVVGSSLLCGPLEAAIANGMLAHSDETDDSHAPSHSHPGCSVVPAALASGEYFGISGARFLRAVALGYDIGSRVTMTLGGFQYQMQSHRSNHCIAGNFGSAAAAGCAAGLNAQQMRWLLDYAAQQASGVAAWQRDTQHIEKSFVFAGMPARNGVTAALLIHSGGTGVEDIFSGPDNFLLAFSPSANPTGLIDKLGSRYEVTRTNIKKWTVGSPIQAPLDALENLRKRHPFEADEVQKLDVRMANSEAHTVNNREMPDICLQHMMAVMLVDKNASFRAAHDKARMQDPVILRQRAKVQLVPDEQLERLYPKRVAVLELTLKDGTHLTERVEAVRGTVENPMTRDEVVQKARDLLATFLDSAKCTALIDAVLNLDHKEDIRSLRPLLQRS
ncbi:MAG TPA: MmgE/PrpD family protein [Terriglobales bacterium]|nr:MmgE/PrpD family protein [Terriglobales bacterium]